MPMQRDRYPADWDVIALAVKVAADWVCQDCGMQCRKPGEPFDTHKRTMSVHHVGAPKDDGSPGDPHDKADVRACNLLALCSKCHLARDLPIHMANAAKTRAEKKHAAHTDAGQLSF